MYSYTLKSPTGSQNNFTFNTDGVLIEFKADVSMADAALKAFLQYLPHTIDELRRLNTKLKGELIEIPVDLSFERFWNEYDYKVGTKEKCRKLWDSLSDEDKVKCLLAIPRYNRYLKVKQGIERIYPERFISHRRFENDFKA